jgi:YD repeat-containing protein
MKKLNFPLLCQMFLLSLIGFISASSQAQTVKYKYDALGRLTFVEDATNGNRDFDYDKAGNRLLVSASTVNDAAAEPGTPGATPSTLTAPTGLSCYQSNGPTAWKGSWSAVPNAHYYVFRLGDNYVGSYVSNEPNNAIRVNGTSTNVMSINTSTMPCKWVKACDANNNCGPQAYF